MSCLKRETSRSEKNNQQILSRNYRIQFGKDMIFLLKQILVVPTDRKELRIFRNFRSADYVCKFTLTLLSEEENIVTRNFREWTLMELDKTFHLRQTMTEPVLDHWLSGQAEIPEMERHVLTAFREKLIRNVHDWNEAELAHYFICPVLTLADYSTDHFNLFAERLFQGVVDGVEMSGKPDGIIASGWREPEKPFFCFQEYKKETDPEGDPAAQVLAAMLVAQEISEHRHPVYGCHVKGRGWFFMILQARQYAISEPYIATRDDIFDIFRILRVLRQIILSFTNADIS